MNFLINKFGEKYRGPELKIDLPVKPKYIMYAFHKIQTCQNDRESSIEFQGTVNLPLSGTVSCNKSKILLLVCNVFLVELKRISWHWKDLISLCF